MAFTRPIGIAALIAAIGIATAAHAELGGRLATIETDRAHFTARMAQTSTPGFVTYTLEPPYGGTVHEYADNDGVVFAVAWHGPGRPDLRQLLGGHFTAFQTGSTAHGGRLMRRHLTVEQSNLVVRSSGHPGAFFGIAYIPSLLPSGTTVDDLH